MRHTIRTAHIQRLIANAAKLAEAVNGEQASYDVDPQGITEVPHSVARIPLPEDVQARGHALPEHMLCKAISDLRHAADELDAERLSCFGWRQV